MGPSSQSPMTMLVLHENIGAEARADELDTLLQVEQVSAALRQLGWRVSTLQAGLDLDTVLASIKEQQPDCVFNLVESLGGDGQMVHFIPALLRAAGMLFTGCDSDAIYLSSQKQMAKKWMRLNGIPTPPSFSTDAAQSAGACWIVKSLWEHASFGMDDGCVVNGLEATRARLEESATRYGGEWFAEQFIDGREFNISVLEQDGQPFILPMAEIGFSDYPDDKPKIVGYAAKWDEEAPEYHATPRTFPTLPGSLFEALTRVVYKCWQSFGLKGYARVDIRVDEQGRPWVLEVNANPCLSRDAGFAAAAGRVGMSYEQLIEQVVAAVLITGSPVGPRTAAHTEYLTTVGKG